MYSFQLTKKFVGIDIGTHSLKIGQCQRSGEKVTLVNYEILKLPEGLDLDSDQGLKEISAFIRETQKTMRIKASDTAFEVTGPWTVARYLSMPDLADDEMREAIRWSSRADFPFSLDDAVIDFYKLGVKKQEKEEAEAEIISAVATREVIEQQIALLKESGLRPLFLSIPPFNLMQAYRVTQPVPWTETAAILDLGSRSTKIIVLKEGKLKFSREIAVAGDVFTQALVGKYDLAVGSEEISEEVAERIKIKTGLREEEGADPFIEGIPIGQIQKRLSSVMDRLLLEVERSLSYYKNQFKDYEIERILITGGGSLLKGLPEALEKNLEIPTHYFQSPGTLTLRKKINEELFVRDLPFLTTLLGLITQTRPFINLGDQVYLPQVKRISPQKFLKPALVSLLPIGIILFFGSQYWTANRQVAKLQKEISAKKEQLIRIGKPVEELGKLEMEETQLNQFLGRFPKIDLQNPPYNRLMKEISRLVPPRMTLTRFELFRSQEIQKNAEPSPAESKAKATDREMDLPTLTMENGREKGEFQLTIQGLIFGSDQEMIAMLSEFTKNLNRSVFFKEAKVLTTALSKEYSTKASEFKILAKLKKEERTSLGLAS